MPFPTDPTRVETSPELAASQLNPFDIEWPIRSEDSPLATSTMRVPSELAQPLAHGSSAAQALPNNDLGSSSLGLTFDVFGMGK